MKRYEITLKTTATVVVTVDASDADEACDMAIDYLDEDDIQVATDWETTDVCEIDPRD